MVEVKAAEDVAGSANQPPLKSTINQPNDQAHASNYELLPPMRSPTTGGQVVVRIHRVTVVQEMIKAFVNPEIIG